MATQASTHTPPQQAVSQFDFEEQIALANEQKPWPSGIYSQTLLKQRDMRLVLTLMEKGAGMDEHHADGSVSVQVLRGKIRMKAQGSEYELAPGQLGSLSPSLRHDVQALEPTACLITISWPDSEKLRSMPHRGYGS